MFAKLIWFCFNIYRIHPLNIEVSPTQDLRSQLNGTLVFNGTHTQTLTSRPPERYHSIFKRYDLLLGGKRRILPIAEIRKAAVLTHHQCAGNLQEGLVLLGIHPSRNPRLHMSYCSSVLRTKFLNIISERTQTKCK